MNDFFSVIDDFDFEEIVADDNVLGSFSFDTAGETSGEIEAEDEDYVNNVNTDAEEATEEHPYVWKQGTSPFTNASQIVAKFSDDAISTASGTNEAGVEYYEVGITDIEDIEFGKAVEVANPVTVQFKNKKFDLAGSLGNIIQLVAGKMTGGAFGSGSGMAYFKVNSGAADYTGDGVWINVEGFSDPDDDAELTAENFGWVVEDEDLKEVNTSGEEGGSVTVKGDYDFSVDDHAIKIKNVDVTAVDLENADDTQGAVTFTYGEDGAIELDISGIVAEDGKTLTVLDAGDADTLVPPDADAATEIKIGDNTFTYISIAGNDDAKFMLENGEVTGFILADEGDSITVGKNSDISVYNAEDLDNPLATVDGAGYTVAKTADGYELTLLDSATVTVDGTEMEFTISKTTKNSNAFKNTGIVISLDEEGELESVDGIYTLNNSGDSFKVTGDDVTSEDGGLPVIPKKNADPAYISVSDGDFTLKGGKVGEQELSVAEGATVYAVYNDVNVVTTSGTGEIVDGANNVDYTEYSGGYFTATAKDNITGYVFTNTGDYVVVPTAAEDFTLTYDDEDIDVPDVTGDEDGYKVTLNADKNFVLGNLSEDAVVAGDNMNVTAPTDEAKVVFNADGDIVGVEDYEGDITIPAGEAEAFKVNGTTITTAEEITVTGDGDAAKTITGLNDGDAITVENGDDVEIVFAGDGSTTTTETYTVNGATYTINGDADGVTITPDGDVTGLDADASLTVNPAQDITVNGDPYTKEQDPANNAIYGYTKKNTEPGSYIEDPNYPLFNKKTNAEIADDLGIAYGVYGADRMFYESLDQNVEDHSTDTLQAQVFLDDDSDGITTQFNDMGKNLAVVTAAATGDKNIILGAKGDAVIINGQDENGHINVTVGSGNDTIVVKGPAATDAVLRGAATKTIIDMGGTANKESVDKIITYAEANANITLNNYDETGKSGVVLHDPEIPYIKDLTAAIEDGLLVFEDGQVIAIDRDETATGVDRKTSITVNNVNSAHQSMIRLYGYKDSLDTYSDDFGQLVGFTGKTGGVLDASDIDEELVLIGNMNNDHTAGSSLKGGAYDDTIFAGANDTIDAGDGVDTIILDDTVGRDAATIIVGKGAGDAVVNLQDGFTGDIFDVTSFDGKLEYTFEDGVLAIADKSTKSILAAQTTVTADFVTQRFVNGSDVLYAAIAKEGGKIAVTDADDTVPNYYLAADGAIDFTGFSGEVHMDVDGEDNDWTGPNQVGATSNVTLGSSVNSLIGGTGTTIFKGGKGNETLVAGTGESSLYGGGGKNVLVGQYGSENKVGSTEFFNIGIHNGAQNTVTGFEFIANGGTNQATFDALNLGMSDGNDVTKIKVEGTNVVVAVKGDESGATEQVTIADAANKEFLVDRGTETETVAQIAATENVINNSYVDFYSATEDHATIKVGSSVTSAKVWLDAPDHNDGVEYVGSYDVIDARGSSAAVELVGQDNHATTIYGGLGNASMWGGAGNANDVMYGGSAHNEFYFEAGNGHDTIMSANSGDIIHLGVAIDQVDFDNTNITSTGVEVALTDGSKLSINSTAEVSFSFDDGTAARVNRQTQQFE